MLMNLKIIILIYYNINNLMGEKYKRIVIIEYKSGQIICLKYEEFYKLQINY